MTMKCRWRCGAIELEEVCWFERVCWFSRPILESLFNKAKSKKNDNANQQTLQTNKPS